MVKLLTACPRCRATACKCGYAAEMKRKRAERDRQRRPYDHAERMLHASIIAEWVAHNGWLCPGAPDLGHKAHRVKPGHLDVDDIVPVKDGGDRHDPRNKRVLCRTANRGRRT
jgi:hypothetical protein